MIFNVEVFEHPFELLPVKVKVVDEVGEITADEVKIFPGLIV